MKRTLLKILFCICVSAMLFAMATVGYAEEEKLYEKYGYDENFEYESEYIGHALKSTTVLIQNEVDIDLEYDTFEIDDDAFFTAMDEELGSNYGESDVALLLRDYLDSDNYDFFGSFIIKTGETLVYDFYDGPYSSGSGAVVSEDGYIISNSHVVSISEEEVAENLSDLFLNYEYNCVYEDCQSMAQILGNYCGIVFSDYDLDGLTSYLYYNHSTLRYDIAIEQYAYFPSSTGDTDFNEAVKRSFDVVYDSEMNVDVNMVEGFTKDLAIVKARNVKNLVALELSESYPQSNSKVNSAGFPGISELNFDQVSTASSLSATIEEGTVSRVVAISGQQYKAIQISNNIASGNSGGPSVDKTLKIEGLNTYGWNDGSGAAGVSYMIPAEYIVDMLDDEDVEVQIGDTTKTFLTGVQLLQLGYGDAAEECFEYVRKSQKQTPFVEELIETADELEGGYPEGTEPVEEPEEKPEEEPEKVTDDKENEEDTDDDEAKDDDEEEKDDEKKSDVSGFAAIGDFIVDNILLICCIGGGILLVAAGLVVLFVILAKKKKKKKVLEDKIAAIKHAQPAVPAEDDNAKTIVMPAVSAVPEAPAEPVAPTVPEAPAEPVAPAVPEAPAVPVAPAEPVAPAVPEAPVASATPEVPAAPVAAETVEIVSTMRKSKPEEQEESEGSEFFHSADNMDL